jgi:hypothetical protein
MGDLNKKEVKAEKDDGKERLDERNPQATSRETLSDIEETEQDSSLENPRDDIGPSPDGLLHEPDEIKDAGPM